MARKTRKVDVSERDRPTPVHPTQWGARCGECPLRGSTPVYDEGPMLADIAIVGEAPGRNEQDIGLPFVGQAGGYLEQKLQEHGLSRRDVLLCNACLCFPPGGDMKAFLQRERKAYKAEHGGDTSGFMTPVECCRGRLMFSLGIPRCGICMKWDVEGSEDVKCFCKRPKWVKPLFERIPSVLLVGSGALEGFSGEGGIKAKMNYVFENGGKR